MGSTADKIKGITNEVAGEAHQAVGKAVDTHEQQAKVSYRKPKARPKLPGDVTDSVKKVVDKA
ncbi:uncharacterized protein YjbJ (UPF0337 family) [Rhizobium leguminosarum]